VYRVLVSNANVPLWKSTSVKALAYHAHLYSQVIATGLTDEIERWLDSDFESPAGNVIEKVVADAQLTPFDWSRLIRFVAAQDVRTPARLMEMLQRWHQTLPNIMEETLKESVQKFQSLRREGKRLDRSKHIDIQRFPIKVTTELVPGKKSGMLCTQTIVGRSLFLFNLKFLLTNTVKAFLAHKWTILRSPKGTSWLTSDDPVVRLNFHSPTKYDFGGGWGSDGTEIFLPLSPRHLLYTKIGARPPQRGTVVSTEKANWFQRFTIEHAHRLVISNTQEFGISEYRPRKVDAAAFNAEVEQWKRWHEEQTIAEQSLFSPSAAP
jgi:hypothetical protein